MTPHPAERLEKTLARVAKEEGVAQERLRRWISFLALCGVLERAVNENVLDSYYLKGGVAMELRFAEGARATKDMDVGVSGEGERLELFRDAVALGFDEFTFQIKGKPLNMDKVEAQRLEVGVRYRTRAWQTIEVDLSPAEPVAVDLVKPTVRGLDAMGLRMPSPIRCLNLNEQIAQKLHACTGPHSKGRARDILDILLIDLLGESDVRAVRIAAEQLFAHRATHAFPPAVRIPVAWQSELQALAQELGYPATSATEIVSRFRAFVKAVADAA